MKTETILLASTVLLFLVLVGIYLYRKKDQFTYLGPQYEKVKDYQRDSWTNLMDLPPGVRKMKQTREDFSGLDKVEGSNSDFQKLGYAYNPQMMDLPPVVRNPRLVPPEKQARDPYSGLPVGVFSVDSDINKFYPKFVPDYLWCKEGVCS